MAPTPRLLLVPLVLSIALGACGSDDPAAPPLAAAETTAEPAALTNEAAETTPAHSSHGGQIVHLTAPTALRARPGGRLIARLGTRTEFDSPRVLPVVRRRGGWYGVLATETGNGRIGWISADADLTTYRTDYRIDVSLTRREVTIRRMGRVVQRFPVAIGGPSTPTPTGRFAVTDKLTTGDAVSPYGCCVLALSARQPHTPQGWGGGDRVAIHATNLPESIGTAASLGCLRGPADAIRRAVHTVPIGTIVRIRAS